LRDLIAEDKIKPSMIVSHQLSLDDAPDASRHFDNRGQGQPNVLLHA
jgi:glutathione-independent formaldehyde dehydrogenase